MRCTVLSYESCPVKTDYDWQVQNGSIVDDVIVSPLCKRTIDVAERLQTFFCQSGTERHGMPLGNSYVESTFGHRLHHDVHRTP